MSEVLEIGDVVKLNLGGSKMTIESIADEEGYVFCVWTDKNDEIQRSKFNVKVLDSFGGSSGDSVLVPKIGDIVTLNSRGSKMKVETVEEGGKVSCVWTNKNDVIQRSEFDVKVLSSGITPTNAVFKPRGRSRA